MGLGWLVRLYAERGDALLAALALANLAVGLLCLGAWLAGWGSWLSVAGAFNLAASALAAASRVLLVRLRALRRTVRLIALIPAEGGAEVRPARERSEG